MTGSHVESSVSVLYVTTSWDDGSRHDLRLSDLLLRYGIAGTFYIAKNQSRRGLSDSEVRELGKCFEIGGHGINHLKLGRSAECDISEEIYGSKSYIEDLIGQQVTSFAYPYGSYNHTSVDCLAKAGFKLGRTTRAFSEPLVDAPLAQGVTLQVASYGRIATEKQLKRVRVSRLPERLRLAELKTDSESNLSWTDLALRSFEAVQGLGGLWHLWGHSWEIEEHGRWGELETVLSRISTHKAIRFVTNREIPSGQSTLGAA
jgi:hypothetical protein